MYHSAIISVMSEAAIKAGKGMLRDFGEITELQISRKGTHSFATKTDIRTENLLRRELEKARPGYGFLMEESGETMGTEIGYRWIVDPLDGTSNFIHGIPYFCTSIALEHSPPGGKPEIVAGVIYDPMHNDLFFAEKGMGAFLNDRKIYVSNRDSLEGAMLVCGNAAFATEKEQAEKALLQAVNSPACIRHSGATALDLAYLAAGRYDGCWFYGIKPWDMAAGSILIREAKGMIQRFNGAAVEGFSGDIVATNQALNRKIVKLLAE